MKSGRSSQLRELRSAILSKRQPLFRAKRNNREEADP